jgi:hypothetical protein
MNTSSNISSLYDNFFTLLVYVVATFIFSTTYTYPFQIMFIIAILFFAIKYIKTMVELNRLSIIKILALEAISLSPTLNMYSEIWRGMLYIRHCTNISEVKDKFFSVVDENNKA